MLRRKKLGHFPYENLPVWSDVGDDFLICANGSGRESNPRSSVLSGLVETENQGQQEACGISALRAHGQGDWTKSDFDFCCGHRQSFGGRAP